MAERVNIRVFEVVGSGFCVASDDGQKVYEQISAVLKEGRGVELSFANVESLTSAFLNSAIGQLYHVFSEEKIKEKLKVIDMEPDDLALLKRVVDTAKAYFKDPDRFNRTRKQILEEEDD